jgi:hypothetical protein
MPPKYLQQRSPTRLKPCSERMVAVCDDDTHAGCCKVPPCNLCLTLTIYGEDPVTGSAGESATGWTGTVGGYSFRSYWERNYGVCEYVVEFDGEEVYRATCAEGASCRNPAGSVEVEVGYPSESATLEWVKHEPLELPLITDPDTGCRTFFCGDCRCSCQCLCVDVSEVLAFPYSDFTDEYSGEICNMSYECDGPVWYGVVGSYELSLALSRDSYGNCIIIPTVNGYEQEPVSVTGCSDLTARIELDDGSTIDVRCKQCGCERTVDSCICGRPMSETLTLYFASANAPGSVHSVTLSYGSISEPGITCLPFSPDSFPGYTGSFSGTLAIPMGGSREDTIEFRMVCECTNCDRCIYYRFGSDPDGTWCTANITPLDCNCPALLEVDSFADASCDNWSYQIFDITIVENTCP